MKQLGKYLFRSQIDCWNPDLEGPHKAFDLKTRATVAIRLDINNYKDHLGYKLNK
jgi:hypothetical protein